MARYSLAISRPARKILLASMAVTSYLLYSLSVLALHQDRSPGWTLERAGPIPVAVSYLIYRTPLGAADDNVLMRFLHPNGASVQDILATAATGSIPPGALDPYWYDGLGAGTDLFAIAAMWTFGPSLSSLVLFYLAIVGLSVLAFVARFRDHRLNVVPLYFLIVTILLLTPLCASADAVDQAPIGGHRYFVLAAFLPALHIYFEISERFNSTDPGSRILSSLLLLTQALLLFGILLVRTSASYLLGPLLLVLMWQIYKHRKQRDQLIPLFRKSAIVAAAFALWAAFVVVAMPAYVQTGHMLGVFWHRAFISFALHPDWPFGDLQQVYNCTPSIPTGLSRTAGDQNGHCVWLAYQPNATRPTSEVTAGLYGSEYEKVLRNAYFDVLIHYPKQVFDLYLVIKSEYIKNILTVAWKSLFELTRAPVPKSVFLIAATQLILFIAFIIAVVIINKTIVPRQLLIIPVFFLFSLPPLYVAWAMLWTSVDMVFLMYSCILLAGLLVIEFTIRALTRNIASGAYVSKLQHRTAVNSPQ
jgi:hypothetical protein